MSAQGETALEAWLEPFVSRLNQRRADMAGLVGPDGDECKSLQPIAERLAPGNHDRLHHCVSAGAGGERPREAELLVQADRPVGGSDAVLVIDDAALPRKKEMRSVDVAPHYAGVLGKRANRETLVALTLARAEVSVRRALRICFCRRTGPAVWRYPCCRRQISLPSLV